MPYTHCDELDIIESEIMLIVIAVVETARGLIVDRQNDFSVMLMFWASQKKD